MVGLNFWVVKNREWGQQITQEDADTAYMSSSEKKLELQLCLLLERDRIFSPLAILLFCLSDVFQACRPEAK